VKRIRSAAVTAIAAVTAAGLSTIAACGSTGQAPASASTPDGSAYSFYRTMMGRFHSGSSGSMMGSTPSRSWMMSGSGYRWMTGGAEAPAWMRGRALPGYMMGTTSDAGKVMGALFADSPGARVSPARAARLGGQVPAGATASRTRHRISFSGTGVRLVVVASPSGGPAETFRIDGMADPVIAVKTGARVSIVLVNAGPGTAHGLVVAASHGRFSWMPMATASPAFPGSALWFLGSPTSAGMHAGTLTFTASTSGTYRYLSPVPGQAQEGMAGTFIVSSS
jgi:FtsP/CotA-like multicopper oxidase with cupredoxin domain